MSDHASSDVGTRKLFENDRIRVWEMRLEPGEEGEIHRHDLDYVMIQISGDRIGARFEPGSGGSWAGLDHVEGDVAPGLTIWAERGGVERAVNVGDEPFHEIIVELKD